MRIRGYRAIGLLYTQLTADIGALIPVKCCSVIKSSIHREGANLLGTISLLCVLIDRSTNGIKRSSSFTANINAFSLTHLHTHLIFKLHTVHLYIRPISNY